MEASVDVVHDLQDNPEADPLSFARNIALRQLSMAPKSRKQLEDKMKTKGVPEDITAQVLDRFTEIGLVNDLEFARMLVRARCASKKISRNSLKYELRQKGIDQNFIDEVLEDVTDEDEYTMASDLVAKKLRSMSSLEPDVRKRRLSGLLARKGYSSSVVMRVLRDAHEEIEYAESL